VGKEQRKKGRGDGKLKHKQLVRVQRESEKQVSGHWALLNC
jgi:hypothetical protein